jgi:CubicO group peptidase (beta-lactamase class C family)
MQYRKTQNRTPGMSASFSSHTVISANDFPLLFAPGKAWEYSVGIDFAGVMVERANNTDLESYLQTHLWGPLGMKNMTFHPVDHPEVMAKLADMSERSGGVDPVFGVALDPNGKVKYTADTVWNLKTKDCHGGAGGYGPPVEYYKLLHSLLTNNGKVLRKETVDEMFKPQLTSAARASLAAKMAFPEVNETFGGFPKGVEADWGIGGIMNLQAFPGRSEGSLAWGGYPNLSWWVDRKAGWAGIQGSQICPPGDVKTNRLFREWVVEMQRRAGSKGRL